MQSREDRLIYSKKYYSDNKQKERDRKNKFYKNKRLEMINCLGNNCKCGCNDYRCLQFDHINGDGGKEIRSYNGGNQYLLNLYKKFKYNETLFKSSYQLLCANCNWIKRFNNKEYGKTNTSSQRS